MEAKIKKIHPNAKIPTKYNQDDAGYDLYSVESITLNPNETIVIHTGICMEITQGYYGQIETRSSMALRGIFTTGGVIDAGYRDEILVILNNISNFPYPINVGDRIAQIIFHEVNIFNLREVKILDIELDRKGGFGSSGK